MPSACAAFLEEMVKPIAPLAIIQSRAKSVSSFAEKIQRKRHKYDDPVHQLTDLCGARIIVQTRSQVDKICNLIEESFEIECSQLRRQRSGNLARTDWLYLTTLHC